MKQREYGSIGVGTSSILLIAVVLCLTVFCSLALLSAKADARLSEKTLAATAVYYAADAAAQRKLAAIDAQLAAGTDVTIEGVTVRDGHAIFTEPISETLSLRVELEILPEGLARYQILYYNVTSETNQNVTDTLQLYGTEGE